MGGISPNRRIGKSQRTTFADLFLSGARPKRVPCASTAFYAYAERHLRDSSTGRLCLRGPYAHHLLGIDADHSQALHAALEAGEELLKPGWVRLNFSYLMQEETVRFIAQSVLDLAARAHELVPLYAADPATARFKARAA